MTTFFAEKVAWLAVPTAVSHGSIGLEQFSDISLTDHCLLRKLTVKGRLGVLLVLITLVAVVAHFFSSLRPIPQAVYMSH